MDYTDYIILCIWKALLVGFNCPEPRRRRKRRLGGCPWWRLNKCQQPNLRIEQAAPGSNNCPNSWQLQQQEITACKWLWATQSNWIQISRIQSDQRHSTKADCQHNLNHNTSAWQPVYRAKENHQPNQSREASRAQSTTVESWIYRSVQAHQI